MIVGVIGLVVFCVLGVSVCIIMCDFWCVVGLVLIDVLYDDC